MRTSLCTVASVLVVSVGCGSREAAPECCQTEAQRQQIEAQKARVQAALLAADRAAAALQLLGILPDYTCGEPRRTWVGAAAESLSADFGCVEARAEQRSEESDALVVTFAPAGCTVRGHTVSGETAFVYSGGEDRLDVTAQLASLVVDGASLQASVGYGTCGDETSYRAHVTGETYSLNAEVSKRDGPPVIGSTTLIIDGTGTLISEAGNDTITLTALEYEPGSTFPNEGEILIETADGHRVRVTFIPVLWSLQKAEIQVDDEPPVTAPIWN